MKNIFCDLTDISNEASVESFFIDRMIDFLHYEDYDAIDIRFTDSIPDDYLGIMGVPITFMDKYNPNQFEIINCCEPCISLKNIKDTGVYKEIPSRQKIHNGILCQKTYHRILIRKK